LFFTFKRIVIGAQCAALNLSDRLYAQFGALNLFIKIRSDRRSTIHQVALTGAKR